MEHAAIIPLDDRRCVYCLRPFTGRARCCSPWCERRVGGRAAYVTRSRREAVSKLLGQAVEKGKRRGHWRRAITSPDPTEALEAIFGIDLSSSPVPRHGETLT